ncbi:hypothetical protein [Dyella sp. 2HG41-7]|uniref:hypothetical protein n=1 Tax=Dyella sp. 2HG41-7 TaxID=2883239 RepID=UPI001F15A245|nr:hypothetical protein [Dyella sp. 2HG41-7]
MRLTTLSLTLALILPLAATGQDISKINGTVSVNAGEHAGNVSAVNGSVSIGDRATVQEASTVNGAVELGSGAQANSLHTVNGSVSLDQGAKVTGAVESTNGAVSLDQGAVVASNVTNVNGAIELKHAHVGGNIETVSGSIFVGEDSQVDGGIVVHETHGWNNTNHPPHVVIGPHAVVRGTLDFRREVVLQVSDSAQIGPVKGATPVRFSGSQPLE